MLMTDSPVLAKITILPNTTMKCFIFRKVFYEYGLNAEIMCWL